MYIAAALGISSLGTSLIAYAVAEVATYAFISFAEPYIDKGIDYIFDHIYNPFLDKQNYSMGY